MSLPKGKDIMTTTNRSAVARPSSNLPDMGFAEFINDSADSFVAASRLEAADPVIGRFRAALARIQTTELDRLYDRLPELNDNSRAAIRRFSDSLVAKMLDPPLKSLCDEPRSESFHRLLAALQRLFQLSE